MARLQDFQSVTPTGSDNLLIVQSQGQGLSTLNAVGQKVATEITMSSLNTTSKNLVGAVNEVNSKKASDIEYSSGVTVKQAIDSATKYAVGDTIDISGCYFIGQVSNGKYRFILTIPLPKDASGLNCVIENFSIALIGGGNYFTPSGTNTITINGSGNKIGINVTAYFSEQWGALTLDDIYLIRFISGTVRFTT